MSEFPESENPSLLPVDSNSYDASNYPTIRKVKPYLWAIYVGSDLLLSGLSNTKREVERIAEQYGLEADFRIRSDNNEDFVESIRHSKYPVISYIKRQSGKYKLAAWNNWIDYLIGLEPISFEDHDSEQSLNTAINLYGKGLQDYKFVGVLTNYWSGYITNYIRRKEAQRKFVAPSSATTTRNIEFVYVNRNEGNYRSDWKRHRIIKTTDKHIFVDRYPFCGKGYLRSGWRAMVVYAAMLDREIMEKEQCYYHKTYRRTFYTEKQAKKRCRKFFIKGGAFAEEVVELPEGELDWALKLLGIAPWPAMIDAIKKAFSRAAMIHHPDRGGTHQGFIDCTNAKDFLMDLVAD